MSDENQTADQRPQTTGPSAEALAAAREACGWCVDLPEPCQECVREARIVDHHFAPLRQELVDARNRASFFELVRVALGAATQFEALETANGLRSQMETAVALVAEHERGTQMLLELVREKCGHQVATLAEGIVWLDKVAVQAIKENAALKTFGKN